MCSNPAGRSRGPAPPRPQQRSSPQARPQTPCVGSPGDFQAHGPLASAHRSCGDPLGPRHPKGSGPVSPGHQGPSGPRVLKDGDRICLQGREGASKQHGPHGGGLSWESRRLQKLPVWELPRAWGEAGNQAPSGRLRAAQKVRGRQGHLRLTVQPRYRILRPQRAVGRVSGDDGLTSQKVVGGPGIQLPILSGPGRKRKGGQRQRSCHSWARAPRPQGGDRPRPCSGHVGLLLLEPSLAFPRPGQSCTPRERSFSGVGALTAVTLPPGKRQT